MNFARRGFLAVTRRKSRSLILFLVLTIMSTFLLASLAIVEAINQRTVAAREELGSYATLTFDYKKTLKNTLNQAEGLPLSTSVMAYEQEALKLANSDYVTHFNFIRNTYANAGNFIAVGHELSDFGESVSPELVVVGVSDSSFLSVTDGDAILLLSGDHVSKPGEVMLEQKLAEINGLDIGQEIVINQFGGTNSLSLKIVGIYQNHESSLLDLSGISRYSTLVDVSNRLYVYHEDAKFIEPEALPTTMGSLRLPSAGVDRVVYYIDSPQNVDAFLRDARLEAFDWDKIRLDANERAFQTMTEPLVKAYSLVRKIIFATAILGAVIIALMLILWVRERRYETGVLLSLGEDKSKIMGQFLVEVLLITVFAFAVSTFLGNAIAQNFADRLMSRQIETEIVGQEEVSVRDLVNAGLSNSSRLRRVVGVGDETYDPIEAVQVKVQYRDLIKTFGVGLSVIVLSIVGPMVEILRYNPKTILLKVE